MGIRERRLAKFIGNLGSICTLISLFSLIIFAGVSVLIRIYSLEFSFLDAITWFTPGVAAVAGGISAFATYYGWVRIALHKKKAHIKEEAKGEAENEIEGQVEEVLKSVPESLNSMPGCTFSLSNVALGASLAVSGAVYVPEVNYAVHKAAGFVSGIIESISQARENPDAVYSISGKLNLETGISGKKARAELLLNRVVIRSVDTDEEGNYFFDSVPRGEYIVRGRMEGMDDDAVSGEFLLKQSAIMPELAWPPPAIDTTRWEAYAWSPDEQGRYADVFIPGIGLVAVSLGSDVAKKYGLNKIGQKGALVESRQKESESAKAASYSAPQQPLVLALPKPVVFVIPQPEHEQPQAEPRRQREERGHSSGFFLGAGSEINSNAAKGTAMGWNLEMGYDTKKNIALGASAVYSNDMNVTSTIEPTLALRYYIPAVRGTFLQAEAGGSLTQEDGKSSLRALYGTAAGWKLGMDGNWYIEPALRVGYPMVWGTGIKLGKNFGKD